MEKIFNLKNMKKTQGLEKVNRNPSLLASERGEGEENKKKVENFRAPESDYKETSVSIAMMKEMHHGCRINKNSELGREGAGWDWNKHRLFHRVLSFSKMNEKYFLRAQRGAPSSAVSGLLGHGITCQRHKTRCSQWPRGQNQAPLF